jgi:hypothetical protein
MTSLEKQVQQQEQQQVLHSSLLRVAQDDTLFRVSYGCLWAIYWWSDEDFLH